jgi:hypothetical protein
MAPVWGVRCPHALPASPPRQPRAAAFPPPAPPTCRRICAAMLLRASIRWRQTAQQRARSEFCRLRPRKRPGAPPRHAIVTPGCNGAAGSRRCRECGAPFAVSRLSKLIAATRRRLPAARCPAHYRATSPAAAAGFTSRFFGITPAREPPLTMPRGAAACRQRRLLMPQPHAHAKLECQQDKAPSAAGENHASSAAALPALLILRPRACAP